MRGAAPCGRGGRADPVLELRDLCVGHGRAAFVSGLSLEVRPGELVSLIGPNGSGKTTILRTVAGQLSPVSGSIRIGGRDAGSLAPSERARIMASLFTSRTRTELLTCKDIVDAGRYPYTGSLGALRDGDERAVRRVMEAAGVWGLRDRDFAHMSDGQRQRALIARCLAQEPRLLILDEPTSFLDIRSQTEMLRLLRREARERGMAVLTSLHEISLAERASDRVVAIRGGRVMAQGTPDEIFTREGMAALFDLPAESFDPAFGTVEMARAEGSPEVFVVAGAGTGAAAMRALQRAGVPFAAGILFEHDADGVLARGIASMAILAEDFEPVGDRELGRALDVLDGCRALICCRDSFSAIDGANARLLDRARERGIPVLRSADEYLAGR